MPSCALDLPTRSTDRVARADGMQSTYSEHAQDVLGHWLAWKAEGDAALVVVSRTLGGGVRAPGALLAVSASGDSAGYVSGGCIDADVVLNAQAAMRSGKSVSLTYGAGSPFIDLPLPCGGMIEVAIVPHADAATIRACHQRLIARQVATLCLTLSGAITESLANPEEGLSFHYIPKMRLRIAGRGADTQALARLAMTSGIETTLLLRDGQDADEARRLGFAEVKPLKTPSSLPALDDDPWTAFLLAFHDTDWETALLAQALNGPAFYVGAVGSRKTHAERCDRLRAIGIAEQQIDRIRGPVGLVASMRDASMLAISVLAEMVQDYHDRIGQKFRATALVLLAAGQSSRFEDGDKLLAPLDGKPLLAHSASLLRDEYMAARIAVIGPGHHRRAEVLREAGWSVVINAAAETGLASSLSAGLRQAGETSAVDAAVVLLADMPDVPAAHLAGLRKALTPDRSAVMSRRGQALLPPAIFARHAFDRLTTLAGDVGARQVFETLENTAILDLPEGTGADVDTRDDLARLAYVRAAKDTRLIERPHAQRPARPLAPAASCCSR